MQLALLSGASPLTCKQGPVVRLQAGTWEFSIDGLVDSELSINRNSYPDQSELLKHGAQISCIDAIEVRVDFNKRGNERYITVNATRVA